MSLKLNLSGKITDNQIPFTAALNPPTGDLVQVITLPNGAAHAPFVVRLTNTGDILIRGVDWNYCYPSPHAQSTFDIEAYAGIYILNKALTGDINFTPNYLGGGYGDYNSELIVSGLSTSELNNLPTWDSELSSNIDTEDLSGTPAGRVDISLDDLISLLGDFKDITSDGINTSEVLDVLASLVENLQSKTIDVADTDITDVVELLNTIKYELTTLSNSSYLEGMSKGADLTLPHDLSNTTPANPIYYRVVTGGDLTYYHTGNKATSTISVDAGNVVILPAGGGTVEVLTSRTEVVKHQPMVDNSLPTAAKDVTGALNELAIKVAARKRSYTFNGFLSQSINLTSDAGPDSYWYTVAALQVTVPTQPNGDVQTISLTNNQVVVREDNLYRIANNMDLATRLPFIIPSLPGEDKTIGGELLRINRQIEERKTKTGQVVYGVMGLTLNEKYRSSTEGNIETNDPLSPELGALLDNQFNDSGIPHTDVGMTNPSIEDFIIVSGYPSADVTVLNVAYSTTLTKFAIRLNVAGVGHVLALCGLNGESYTELSTVTGMDGDITDFKVKDSTLLYSVGVNINTIDLTDETQTAYDYSGTLSVDIAQFIPFDEATGFYLVQLTNGNIIWLAQDYTVATGADLGLVYDAVNDIVFYKSNNTVYWLVVPTDYTGTSNGNLHFTHPVLPSVSTGVVIEGMNALTYIGTDKSVVIHKGENTVTVLESVNDALNPVWVTQTNKLYYVNSGSMKVLTFTPSLRTYIRG